MRISLGYEEVHERDKFKVRHYWDGWTLVFLRYSPTAYISKNAVYRHGKWYSVIDRVVPNKNGLWRVRDSYVA